MATQTMNKQHSKLKEFFTDQLQDIYWAEKKLLKTLPKLEEAATTSQLKNAFSTHLGETKEHVERLERIFFSLDQEAIARKCPAMSGIAEEGAEIIEETAEGSAQRDVGLIFAAQKAEHYEIATYGGLVTLAKTLNYDDVANILALTLEEEKRTDSLLTDIAENDINYMASQEPG